MIIAVFSGAIVIELFVAFKPSRPVRREGALVTCVRQIRAIVLVPLPVIILGADSLPVARNIVVRAVRCATHINRR